MFNEQHHASDVNITHDLSQKISINKNERNTLYANDIFGSSKIEVRINGKKGVH